MDYEITLSLIQTNIQVKHFTNKRVSSNEINIVFKTHTQTFIFLVNGGILYKSNLIKFWQPRNVIRTYCWLTLYVILFIIRIWLSSLIYWNYLIILSWKEKNTSVLVNNPCRIYDALNWFKILLFEDLPIDW